MSELNRCLYVVIPCYNEEDVILETAGRLSAKIDNLINKDFITPDSRIVFINDGSKDRTWEMIQNLHDENKLFSGINLSRNRGHQNALLAGLMTVKDDADMVISMDADLQDDIEAMDEMIHHCLNGSDIVYAVRSKRLKDSILKRFTAEAFYRLMNLLGAETVFNHADYRLMNKRALESLSEFQETNLFLRGIIPMIGYKSSIVTYERAERFAGESKYPLVKMIHFAVEGITSFSVRPLRFIAALGLLVFFVSILIFIYIVVVTLQGRTVAGWASSNISVWTIGGLMLLSLGIIGEYIGKIYLEVKGRPRFIIDSFINDNGKSKQCEVNNE